MKSKNIGLEKKTKNRLNQPILTFMGLMAIVMASPAFSESCPATGPDYAKLISTESVDYSLIICHYQRCNDEGYCTYTGKKILGYHQLTGGEWKIIEPGDQINPHREVCWESCAFVFSDRLDFEKVKQGNVNRP